MKRTRIFSSLPGLIFSTIFLVGLALSIWRSGGQAFSPGRLSAQNKIGALRGGYQSHQEFEPRCNLCHAPLKTTQDKLCLECHTEVASQIQLGLGTHSLVKPVSQCYGCHSEHKGQNFNILQPGLKRFDHAQTGFSLVWHQIDYDALAMDCSACHASDKGYSLELSRCQACHMEHDPAFMTQHAADFGQKCLACHTGDDNLAKFDHAQTKFPLEGRHSGLACAQCHPIQELSAQGSGMAGLKNTPSDCQACHADPPAHKGLFGSDCAACHTPAGWQPAAWKGKSFDHLADTAFSLALHTKSFQGQWMDCTACHGNPVEQVAIDACINCHAQGKAEFMQRHQEQFGRACLDCHDGVDRLSHFDHANFFKLDGAHVSLECQACHKNQVYKGAPSACSECHAEPKIHAGVFGLQCQDCHTTQAWTPAQLQRHSFPLDHGRQAAVACQTCHPNSYVEYTCFGCHEHVPGEIAATHQEEKVLPADLPNCTKCHPTGLKQESGND
jgi:hypothetical protein